MREYTPMLLRGNAGTTKKLDDGKLPGGFEGVLAHQTFRNAGTDGDDRSREFTVVVGRVPESIGFVKDLACRDKRAQIKFEKRDLERFGSPKNVELESSDFNHRYQLEAIPGQDEVFLRELFSPTFIDWLSESAPKNLCFELNDGHLCVGIPGHTDDKDEQDALCEAAAKVAQRIREESAEQGGRTGQAFHAGSGPDPLTQELLPKVSFSSPPASVHDAAVAYLPLAGRQGTAIWAGLKRASGRAFGTVGIVFVIFLAFYLGGRGSLIPTVIFGVLLVVLFVVSFNNGRKLRAIDIARPLGEEAFAAAYAQDNDMKSEEARALSAKFASLDLPARPRQAMAGELPGSGLDGHLAFCSDDVDRASDQKAGIAQFVGAITTALAEHGAPPDAYDVAIVESAKAPKDLQEKASAAGLSANAGDGAVAVWQPCPEGRRARSANELNQFCKKVGALLK